MEAHRLVRFLDHLNDAGRHDMCQIDKARAIEVGREFLENDGHTVIECAHIAHATKEMYQEELGEPHEHGNFVLELVVVTPPDPNYVVKDPRGDIRAVCVNDLTGEAKYISVLD
ncbi:hypothetical protein [Symmachiella dynata]|nr:hypothetical protein [Symmachiella dynata]